jgi:hypothetical protein
MIVADSNTVIDCLKNGRRLPGGLVVPDDLYIEYLIAEARHGEKIEGVMLASALKDYDEVYFIREYAKALNSFGQLSFAKARGFGDVSIIALVSCLLNNFGRRQAQLSLDLGEDLPADRVVVITDDEGLRRKLTADFNNDIDLRRYSDLTH